MKKKGYLFIVLIIIIVNLAAFYYYYRTQKSTWGKKIETVKAQRLRWQKKFTSLLPQLEVWEKEIKAAKARETHWQEKYNNLLPQLEEYKIKNVTLSQKITDLQKKGEEHMKKNELLSKMINELLSKRIAVLQKEKRELIQKIEGIRTSEYLAGIIRDRIRLKSELKDLKEKIKARDTAIVSLTKYKENLGTLLGKEKRLLSQGVAQKSSLFRKLETNIDNLEKSQLLLKGKVKGLEEIVWKKNREIRELEKRLNKAYGKNKVLEKKFSQAKEEKELLEEELVATRRGYEEIKASKNDLENKLGGLIKANKTLSAKLFATDQKTADLDEKLGKMELAISEKELEKKEIEEKYERLEQKEKDTSFMLELTKTITLPEDREEPLPDIKAKILVTSDKYNFIIINIGEEDGVKIGDSFSVYRADRKIGEIEVMRIRSRSSFSKITSSGELSITTTDTIR